MTPNIKISIQVRHTFDILRGSFLAILGVKKSYSELFQVVLELFRKGLSLFLVLKAPRLSVFSALCNTYP